MPDHDDRGSAAAAWDAGEDLVAGRLIYEALDVDERPGWAARLLELACREIEPPAVVKAVLDLAADEGRWAEAHDAFQRVRGHALARRSNTEPDDERLQALLDLAEKTAKVVYNASGCPAPFDHNAGWKVAPSLRQLITAIGDVRFSRAARHAFLTNRTEH